jgi:hypothetical protein
MAVLLATYDLRKPGRNYEPVWAYLRSHSHCKVRVVSRHGQVRDTSPRWPE